MKRAISILLATILLLALPLGAVAAPPSESYTDLTMFLEQGANYVVTIPSAITFGKDGGDLEISVHDVYNLFVDQKIMVFAAGATVDTDGEHYMFLRGTGNTPKLYYDVDTAIYTSFRKTLMGQMPDSLFDSYPTDADREIANFTTNGRATIRFSPRVTSIMSSGTYTGRFTYGIAVVPR